LLRRLQKEALLLGKQNGKLNFVIVVANGERLKEVMLEPPKVEKQRSTHH